MTRSRLLFTSTLAAATLAIGAAHAAVLYDNGAYNGQAAAYNITGGNYVEDSFTIGASGLATAVDFVAWNYPTTSTTTTVGWAIYQGLRAPYGSEGSLLASGTSPVTSSYLLTNTNGYAVNTDTFLITPTALVAGTYSLALFNGTNATGDQVSWDVNSGPSTALVHTNFGPFEGYHASNTFQILGGLTGVPEPASWTMMVAGLGLLGGMARRRRLETARAV